MTDPYEVIAHLSGIFSPGAPIDQRALFSGRLSELREVITAVAQRGHHAVIFGERGVGKTSLANVIRHLLPEPPGATRQVCRVNCEASDTFEAIWARVFREIYLTEQLRFPGFERGSKSETHALADEVAGDVARGLGPDDVRYHFSRVSGEKIVILDEVDRIIDSEVVSRLADTVKTLSDHSVDSTIVLVGVADSVTDLIQEHASVERALVQIHMPRMSAEELAGIIDDGLARAKMSCHPTARASIVDLSQGLPHYTHLLVLNASQEAALDNRRMVELSDVDRAMTHSVRKAQQSIRSTVHRATMSSRSDALFVQVLLACALATTDDLGYFAAADVRDPISCIMRRRYEITAFSKHLNSFCDEARGPILKKIGTRRRFRFRFVNPLLQPYVTMLGLSRGLISRDDVRELLSVR